MNNPFEQSYLAGFAPKKSLDNYAKGADPRVINDIIALSELKEQAAMRQRADLASGAAQGQMPTVRDKIIQMFQQANQPRQQPQQQPNPMAQGIMAQAPQEVPQEAQMYHGGVARLPVSDRMFGYAGGGIIAFNNRGSVPKAEGDGDEKLTPEQIRDILSRMPTAADEPIPDANAGRARTTNVRREDRLPNVGANIPRSLRPGIAGIYQGEPQAYKAPQEERESEMMRAVKTPFRAISEGIKSLYASNPNATPSPIGAADQDLAAAITNTERAAPTAAPSAKPQLNEIERLNQGIMSGGEGRGIRATPEQLAALRRGPVQPPRTQTQVPGGPGSAPPSGAPGAKPPTVDQLLEQQRQLMQTANAPVTGPQLPEKSITEKATDFLQAQEDYVKKTGDSEAAKKLSALYDKMEKRALADDDAQAAQRAADSRNNLWSFLANTRGSSLATAAGKADAALQPMLAEQKKTNAEYRKYSYERDMNREKARVEAIAAEDARKRGDFAKAIEHEQKERSYTLEAQKAKDLADHYKRSDYNQVLNIEATRQTAKEGHQVQREGHGVQLEIARLNRQATLAAHPDYVAEYEKRITRDGQKAADAWLDSVGKVLGVTKGYDFKEGALDVQRDKAVTAALKEYEPYNRAQNKVASLESQARTGKLTPKKQAELDAARADVQRYYDQKYQEIHGTARPARSAGTGTPGQVMTEADVQATMKSSGRSREEVIAAARARGYTIQ